MIMRSTMALLISSLLAGGCGGGEGSTGDPDATEDTTVPDTQEDTGVPDAEEDTVIPDAVDVQEDTATPDAEEDTTVTDPPADIPTDGSSGYHDELGTNNQDIVGVQRVIFLGDSITASPYLTPPWSDRIEDDLRTTFGSGIEIHNYAVGGARTEDVLDDQLDRIDTSSSATTLVMFTIGGNDALQVIGEDIPTSLAHMETKIDNLRGILDFLSDPSNFPGGIYVVFANVYDPTDGEGDFTHCGIAAGYGDWPDVDELANTVNGWYLDLANEYGFDVLDTHGLFLSHGWNNADDTSPHYCEACEPDCPCERWLDFTCIHPNADGHTALAGFFHAIVTR